MREWAGEHDLSLVARVEKAVQALAKSSLNVRKPVVAPVMVLGAAATEAIDGAATEITMQDLDEAWKVAEAMDVKAGALVLDEMEEEIMRFVLSAILRKHYEDADAHDEDASATDCEVTRAAADDDTGRLRVAVLIANWTGQGDQDGLDYAQAAQDQLDYLLQDVPKTEDGAISHRVEQVELW